MLAFYTDVLGITAAAAGLLFLIARIWDGVNDPMMGLLADTLFQRRASRHNKKRVDKFRIYLLKGSWPVVLAAILMFYAPSGFSTSQRLVWAYTTYILWGMAYTFVNIPYGSLAAVMTQNPIERSQLASARGIGSLIGSLLPRAAVPLIFSAFAQHARQGYLVSIIAFSALAFASYLVSYFTVEERIIHNAVPAADVKNAYQLEAEETLFDGKSCRFSVLKA